MIRGSTVCGRWKTFLFPTNLVYDTREWFCAPKIEDSRIEEGLYHLHLLWTRRDPVEDQ